MINFIKRRLYWLILKIAEFYIRTKWRLFGNYYGRLASQTAHIYRTSDRFRERWQILGLEGAEAKLMDDAKIYFEMAQKMPVLIRLNWFADSLFGVESPVYDVEIIYESTR